MLIVTDLDKCDTFLEQDKEKGPWKRAGRRERLREREGGGALWGRERDSDRSGRVRGKGKRTE